ncbi:MAG: nitrilase-related carbon-nitrogen hydrolase [Acidimicrobiales bacterium]
MVRIAAVQCDIVWEDAPANYGRVAERIAAAADEGARLVLLPEMFATGFSLSTERIAEAEDGPTASFLCAQAAANNAWVAGSFACRIGRSPKPTNRFLVAAPDGRTAVYDKVHPFTPGGEADHYAAGDRFVTIEIEDLRVTPFVCYDLRFADWFWRAATGTDCYVVVANWPAERQTHWAGLLRARAIENEAYVVGVNRVGNGGGTAYAGRSVAFEPFGDLVAEAGFGEEILTFEIDPDLVARVRSRFPFLKDR